MGVDLYFFMRKRGLTIDKIVQKYNIDSVSHFVSVMTKLGVDVPKTSYDAIEISLTERTESIMLSEEELKSDADIIVPHVIDTFQRSSKKKKRHESQQEE